MKFTRPSFINMNIAPISSAGRRAGDSPPLDELGPVSVSEISH